MMTLAIALLLFIGIYTLMFSRNMIRMLIGLEIMVKGVSLLLVAVGTASGNAGVGQAMFITMLVMEVVVAVVVLAFIIHTYRQTGSLDAGKLVKLRD